MKAVDGQFTIHLMFCWLYISIGVCSFALGAYMVHLTHIMGKQSPNGILPIAYILIAFGPVRVANSLWVMRRIKLRAKNR